MTLSQQGRLGQFELSVSGEETVRAYVPPPLPPDPPVDLRPFQSLLEKANQAVGRLDGLASVVPNVALFLYGYIRKEAVLSSQIEGTQSSLSDLLLFESNQVPGVPLEDVLEVSNYVSALNHGLDRLRHGFPLSLRLIREIHAILLKNGLGSTKAPGEFRTSQNWIGGTRPGNALYVPPPAHRVMEAMGQLEKFMHDERPDLPLLVKAALTHVQFESIHPFLDGNGRLGRLLITFQFCAGGVLKEPLLYLSLYFKTHRQTYYDLLMRVREKGDWEAWIEFFLTGVQETAEQAVASARQIRDVVEADREKISAQGGPASSVGKLFSFVQAMPVFSMPQAHMMLDLSFPTISAAVKKLEKLGVVKEITGRERKRVYVYDEYLSILSEGTDSPR